MVEVLKMTATGALPAEVRVLMLVAAYLHLYCPEIFCARRASS